MDEYISVLVRVTEMGAYHFNAEEDDVIPMKCYVHDSDRDFPTYTLEADYVENGELPPLSLQDKTYFEVIMERRC